MTSSYKVGQVLFAIDKKQFQITPLQVVEHHVKTSLQGTKNSYYALIGGSMKKVNIEDLPGPIFDSSKEAGDFLLSVASERIQALVSIAEQTASSFEKTTETSDSEAKTATDTQTTKSKEETMYVELPDGTRAKLSGVENFEDFNS